MKKLLLSFLVLVTASGVLLAQKAKESLADEVARRALALEQKMLTWRRDIHQNPELGNREVRTAKLVAEHLKALGMEVQTGVAVTGVVGLLRGGQPGPVVALRADMDALPVTEQVDVPFASKVTAEFDGQKVGVMHACGHDSHVAILMAVAEVLSQMKGQMKGSVKFIFQPAEESLSGLSTWGAKQMVEEGVMHNPTVSAIFGLHVEAGLPSGHLYYRAGPTMAAADRFEIAVYGKQTHGARPWDGVDPIVASSQIVLGLQTIASRQVNVTQEPSIVSVGRISGGVRNNIIPDSVNLLGTIRTYNEAMQLQIHQSIRNTAEKIAESAGAKAYVHITKQYPATINNPELTEKMLPTLRQVVGADKVHIGDKRTGAEDFSFYQQKVPGLFFFLGVTPEDADMKKAPSNHSPLFYIHEPALIQGIKGLSLCALNWLEMQSAKK